MWLTHTSFKSAVFVIGSELLGIIAQSWDA